jgi:serine/threonine protein kinase
MHPEALVKKKVDKFLITRYVRSGGMADVYEAHDTLLNRRVAMKVLRAELAQGGAYRTRFQREAQAVAGLQHPHIIEIYNVGEMADKRPFFTMPYLPGGTLAEQMDHFTEEGKQLAVPQILLFIRHVAEALAAAHRAGIVHRDLKPANIMLRSLIDPVVMDFGIATLSEQSLRLTQTGAFIGTFLYASPEQQAGGSVDGRSDIYSLGLILFELLCGSLPQIGELTTERLRTARPQLSDYTVNLVLTCIQRESEERFQTAVDLVQAIDIALGGEAETRPSPPLSHSFWQQPWWVYALLPLLLILLGASGIFLYWGFAPTPTPVSMPIAIDVQSINSVSTALNKPDAPLISTSTLGSQITNVAPYTATPTHTPTPTETAVPTQTASPIPIPTPLPTVSGSEPYGRIVFTCFIDQIDQICSVNADSSEYTQLTFEGATSYYASFTPDGNEIFFASRRENAFFLYSMNSDGTAVSRFGSPTVSGLAAPAVSPDGQHVVFTAADAGSQNLWIAARDESNLIQLTHTSGNNVDPVWSPDGTRIAFASDREGEIQHFIMNADGSDVRKVDVNVPKQGGRSDWSPDGRWLAFYAGPGNSRDIYLAAVDGTVVYQLTNTSSNLAPSFSPDGKWIVFTSYRDDDGDGELFIMRIDGSDIRQLTFNTYTDYQPRWQR